MPETEKEPEPHQVVHIYPVPLATHEDIHVACRVACRVYSIRNLLLCCAKHALFCTVRLLVSQHLFAKLPPPCSIVVAAGRLPLATSAFLPFP